MKQIVFFLILIPALSFSLTKDDIEGTWYRVYSVYKPWADDNQGTVSFYEEKIVFDKTGTMYIYRSDRQELLGKSLYKIIQRDENYFITFYSPDQNPKSKKTQDSQGFYINIAENKDQIRELSLLSLDEFKKNQKFSVKLPGILYKKIPEQGKNAQFVKSPFSTK